MNKIKKYYLHIIIAFDILFLAYPFLYYHIALFTGSENRYILTTGALDCFKELLFFVILLVYLKIFFKTSNRVTKYLFYTVLLLFPLFLISLDLQSRMFCGPKIIRLTDGPFTYIERILVNYTATNVDSSSPEEVALENFVNFPLYDWVGDVFAFVFISTFYLYCYSVFRSIKNKKGYVLLMLIAIFLLFYISNDYYYKIFYCPQQFW